MADNSDVEKKVKNFLRTHNRPFSVNDIVQGFNDQSIGKAKLQKSLEHLVKRRKVIVKTYGKQQIYCAAQNSGLTADEVKRQIFDVNKNLTNLSSNLNKVQKNLQLINKQLEDLDGPSIEELQLTKQDLQEEIKLLEEQIENCENFTVDPKESEKVMKEYENLVKEFRKRKRLCNDIVEAIYENYPKTKKHLLEEIGLETDEDVGFVINNNIID